MASWQLLGEWFNLAAVQGAVGSSGFDRPNPFPVVVVALPLVVHIDMPGVSHY